MNFQRQYRNRMIDRAVVILLSYKSKTEKVANLALIRWLQALNHDVAYGKPDAGMLCCRFVQTKGVGHGESNHLLLPWDNLGRNQGGCRDEVQMKRPKHRTGSWRQGS